MTRTRDIIKADFSQAQIPWEIRGQNDGRGDEFSRLAGLGNNIDTDPSMTRQEFKLDTDINTILNKFGIDALTKGRQHIPGAITNYDLDLQTALTTVNSIQAQFSTVPGWLKQRYPTWQSLAEAINNGTADLKEPPPPPVPPTPEEAAELAELRKSKTVPKTGQ